jgi:HEAT repeat protein
LSPNWRLKDHVSERGQLATSVDWGPRERAINPLRALVRGDSNDVVRDAAADALGHIGPAALSAAPDLMASALELRFPETALRALAMLGPSVIPYVLPWLDETVDKVASITATRISDR